MEPPPSAAARRSRDLSARDVAVARTSETASRHRTRDRPPDRGSLSASLRLKDARTSLLLLVSRVNSVRGLPTPPRTSPENHDATNRRSLPRRLIQKRPAKDTAEVVWIVQAKRQGVLPRF